MKKLITIIVAAILAFVFIAYMVTFQVRYDQVVVLTTFDSATPPDSTEGNSGSVYREPGIYFKWPAPIQSAQNYSKKLQLFEDELEEMQTADGYAIIVRLYLVWKIEDPLAFFRSLKNEEAARKQLLPLLSELTGVISAYRFDELVNTDPAKLKLAEIEEKAAEQLRSQLARIQPGYGISIEQVGIVRLLLPEQTTEAVFARMRETRERLAQKARSEGEAQARGITSEAESAKQRILAFAKRRAEAIRAQGRNEAASYYTAFDEDPQFAIFLEQIDVMKRMLPHNATFIVDSNDLSTLRILKEGPGAEGAGLLSAPLKTEEKQ